jgi:multisubunit Na+/H+ antiporter MnhC subunit
VASITIIALKLAGLVQVQGTALIITAIFFSLGVQSIYLLLIAYALSRATSESSNKRPFLIMSDEELA